MRPASEPSHPSGRCKWTARAPLLLCRRAILAVLLGAFFVSLHLGDTATAGQVSKSAEAFILDLSKRAIESLTDKSLEPVVREERFRNMLQDAIDMDSVSARVLGVYRRKATPEIMAELKPVLEETMVLTYASRFEEYNGETIAIHGSRDGRRNSIIVDSSVTQTSGGPAIPVEWHLREEDDTFRIVDIVVQGNFSMIATHRDQYVPVINKAGGDIGALIGALRENNARMAKSRRQ